CSGCTGELTGRDQMGTVGAKVVHRPEQIAKDRLAHRPHLVVLALDHDSLSRPFPDQVDAVVTRRSGQRHLVAPVAEAGRDPFFESIRGQALKLREGLSRRVLLADRPNYPSPDETGD